MSSALVHLLSPIPTAISYNISNNALQIIPLSPFPDISMFTRASFINACRCYCCFCIKNNNSIILIAIVKRSPKHECAWKE
mmetsp:Transcript_38806/g.58280  ORF Transcript_38806/g.58280 Transcript_38806/m.58280 type:complete len:81 (+) Transcript_38806:781-1023(+)